MGGEVLFDGWCGEPIAWSRVGEPIIGHEWTKNGSVAVTERLTPAQAVRKYGPILELELGPKGGFESVTYGAHKFVSRFVDPRGTALYDASVVVVRDPSRENHECPVCHAAPGEQCVNRKQEPCATHSKRYQGRKRWEIEQADEAARKALQESEAAALWNRDMATPPAIGAVLGVKRRTPGPDQFTVEHTYANRTVQAAAESGEQEFLARNEYTGEWHVICGQPTSMRLPCRSGDGPQCRIQHKAGLHLREDKPWS
jgi:hypothetical protein